MSIEGSTAPDPANWTCQVGEFDRSKLPPGSDLPMREAVRDAYCALTGDDPLYIFSGWGNHLPETYRAVVEDRIPDPAVTLDGLIRDNWHLIDAESVAIILRRMPREAWLMLLDLVEFERSEAEPSDGEHVVNKGARLSEDGAHRYMLWRTWGPGPSMTFVMLNPSTADAEVDDPTIRRCMGFARREGCGEIVVVNLFSYRTPDPRDLVDTIEAGVSPWGPDQSRWMSSALQEAMPGVLVAAWGAHPVASLAMHKLPRHHRWQCLGTTKSGAPRHPLYVKGDAPLVSFEMAGVPASDGSAT